MLAQITGKNRPALIRDEAGNKLQIDGPGTIYVRRPRRSTIAASSPTRLGRRMAAGDCAPQK
jgi:hypothetical protein